MNAWLERGGTARGIRAGEAYVAVGTLHGYREAIHVLEERPPHHEGDGIVCEPQSWRPEGVALT